MSGLSSICPDCQKRHLVTDLEKCVDVAIDIPVTCPNCGHLYWIKLENEVLQVPYTIMGEEIPGLPLGTNVVLHNAPHLDGSLGVIVAKKHKHYRIRITSGVKIGKTLWVHESYVKLYE